MINSPFPKSSGHFFWNSSFPFEKKNTLLWHHKPHMFNMSGQITIFHQPRFPWNKRISLTFHHDLGAQNSCLRSQFNRSKGAPIVPAVSSHPLSYTDSVGFFNAKGIFLFRRREGSTTGWVSKADRSVGMSKAFGAKRCKWPRWVSWHWTDPKKMDQPNREVSFPPKSSQKLPPHPPKKKTRPNKKRGRETFQSHLQNGKCLFFSAKEFSH